MNKLLFYIIIFINAIYAQNISNWQNYSDMQNIHDFLIFNDGIWAASSGGAFYYDLQKNIFKSYQKAEGLLGTNINAITIDNQGKIWFGSRSGMIDVFNPNKNKFSYISDIFNSDRINKGINNFFIKGDTVFIATDYGISLINSVNFFFSDSYFKLGSFPSNIKVNKVFYFNKVFAITDLGLAVQKPNAVNLSAPESWNVFLNSSLNLNHIYDLVVFNNDTIVATDKGIFKYSSAISNWIRYINEFNNIPVIDLEVHEDKLFILSSNNIFLFSKNRLDTVYNSSFDLKKIAFSLLTNIVASSSKGITIIKDTLLIVPNGPIANQFSSMAVDKNSNLWIATGKDNTGKGIMKFDGKNWSVFSKNNYPILNTNDYYSIYASRDNKIFAGSWGAGFVKIDNTRFTNYNASNSPLVGIPGDTNFLVITGFANDSKNNLWILNYWAGNGKPLAMLTPDSIWYSFSIPEAQGRILDKHYHLYIDPYDTKWFVSLDATTIKGLFYFNENKTPNNFADDKSGLITETNGLNSTDISDIKVDLRGDIWVGSNKGVNIISNTSSIIRQTNPQLRITSVFSLRQQSVTAIAVDPLNQKWIATAEGLLLVSPDGFKILASLNSKNSPLLDNRIESLTVDEKTGKVYVGTFLGLNVFETPAIKPKDKFEGLFIYPNPFILKDGTQLLTIDGLVKDSEIKILSSSGNLIKELNTPGGKVAYWNGRDQQNNLVNSGIYIVVASDREANNIEIGKFAVIRK